MMLALGEGERERGDCSCLFCALSALLVKAFQSVPWYFITSNIPKHATIPSGTPTPMSSKEGDEPGG